MTTSRADVVRRKLQRPFTQDGFRGSVEAIPLPPFDGWALSAYGKRRIALPQERSRQRRKTAGHARATSARRAREIYREHCSTDFTLLRQFVLVLFRPFK